MKIPYDMTEYGRCALEDGGWVGAGSDKAANAVITAVLPELYKMMLEPSDDTRSEMQIAGLEAFIRDVKSTQKRDTRDRDTIGDFGRGLIFGQQMHSASEIGAGYRAMLAAFFKEKFGLDFPENKV